MKTIKQIADELGVSKTAVRKKIENLGLSDKVQTNGNRILIDERQERLIKSAFQKAETETENYKPVSEKTETLQLVSDVVSMLQKELDAKNKQIERLQQENERLVIALENTTHSLNASHALHAGTMQKQIEEKTILVHKEEQNQQPEEKQSFWSRLWHKEN